MDGWGGPACCRGTDAERSDPRDGDTVPTSPYPEAVFRAIGLLAVGNRTGCALSNHAKSKTSPPTCSVLANGGSRPSRVAVSLRLSLEV